MTLHQLLFFSLLSGISCVELLWPGGGGEGLRPGSSGDYSALLSRCAVGTQRTGPSRQKRVAAQYFDFAC